MLVSLTVGKVDAGVAVLLTEDKRLIEFPSILLPPRISCGSIVDINVARNYKSEAAAASSFARLQTEIHDTFGRDEPRAPVLRCRNATQTSVVLEWDPLHLATADLRSLSLYRNGAKAGMIPRPLNFQSTKISGLAIDTEYVFQLVLLTSAGTYTSERIKVRTHKMTNLSGITITPGVMPAALRESLMGTVERIGAKVADTVRIDTTQFVCTEGRGQSWEKAVDMNIPVVVPDWLKGCEREGRVVGVRGYYLNADPRMRQVGPAAVDQPQQSQQSQPQPQQQQQQQQQQPGMQRQMSATASSDNTANDSTKTNRSQSVHTDMEQPPPAPPPKHNNDDAATTPASSSSQQEQKQERNTLRTRDLTSHTTTAGNSTSSSTNTTTLRPSKGSESTDRDAYEDTDPYVKADADSDGDDDVDDDEEDNDDGRKKDKDEDGEEDTETETDGDGSYSSAADDISGVANASTRTQNINDGRIDKNDGDDDGDEGQGQEGQESQRFDEVAL